MLCDNLEGWDTVGSGTEIQEGGDIYIPIADSCDRNQHSIVNQFSSNWRKLPASPTEDTGLIPRQGTKIPHAAQSSQK